MKSKITSLIATLLIDIVLIIAAVRIVGTLADKYEIPMHVYSLVAFLVGVVIPSISRKIVKSL